MTRQTEDERQAVVHNAAVRLLARREHSKQELRRKLDSRGYSAAVVEDVLRALANAGLQSDERFAETFVRSSLARGHGPLKIRVALRERGVDGETAETHVDLHGDEWPARAEQALHKRFGARPPVDRAEWAKRGRFLAARGYPADVTAKALGPLDGSARGFRTPAWRASRSPFQYEDEPEKWRFPRTRRQALSE